MVRLLLAVGLGFTMVRAAPITASLEKEIQINTAKIDTAKLISPLVSSDCINSADKGNYFINFCEEKCVCEEVSAGQFDHVCYREREEFTCMSSTRRQRFLNAYKAISTPGHPQYNQFQQLIATHSSSNFPTIHTDQWFLPWHRWFTFALEDLLRNEDCRITVPWWRWSKKSASWWNGTPFQSSPSWLGTDGVSPSQCVTDGAFGTWAPPGDSCLRHNFQHSSMPTSAQIASVLNTPASNFNQFTSSLENTIHNTPHVRIGGHMVTSNSPRSPVFFLHHNYIDQLWDRWQKKSPAHMTSYGSYSPSASIVHTAGGTPSNVQDHFNLKESGVIYVNHKSTGSKFLSIHKCLWLAVAPHQVFSIVDLENGLEKMADEKVLQELPQEPFKVKSLREMQQEFAPLIKELDGRGLEMFNQKLERTREQQIAANQKLRAPVDRFPSEGSNLLGYEVEMVAGFNHICPIGQASRGGACEPTEEYEMVMQELDESVVVGGEVLDRADFNF